MRWLVVLALVACTPAPVPPPTPDASDASSPAFFDASTDGAPLTGCAAACANLTHLCGPQRADCPTVFANVERDRLIRASDGGAISCAYLASAGSKDAVRACGATCP